jgi:hypothetical protein
MNGNFSIVGAETHPLTPALAQEFRDLPPSPTERELIPSRLQHLRRKADAGLLVSFHWAKCKLGGQWYRMNGQHSATMLCELNGTFPDGLFAHVDLYEVASERDLALLFRQFDDRKSSRSAADVAGAYQGLVPNLRDVAKPIAKIGVEAVTWYRHFIVSVDTKKGDEQFSLFHEEQLHRYLLWLGELFSIKTPELKKVPIVAAMHATFEANEDEARKFWLDVARGGKDFEDNAPATVLDEWLKSVKEDRLEIKQGELFRGCVYAWNAYRDDKPIKEIKFDLRKAAQAIAA